MPELCRALLLWVIRLVVRLDAVVMQHPYIASTTPVFSFHWAKADWDPLVLHVKDSAVAASGHVRKYRCLLFLLLCLVLLYLLLTYLSELF